MKPTDHTAEIDSEMANSETTDSERDVSSIEGSTEDSNKGGHSRRFLFLAGTKRTPVVLAVITAAAVATATAAYVMVYKDDAAASAAESQDIVASANEGTEALLSYSPTQLEADFTNAKSYLTGQFLTYYQDFTTKVVQPAATENGVDTKAQVVRSAVSKRDGDSAEVLAFVNQTTTSTPKPEPELSSSSVRITLELVDGRWLISSFDPV